MATDRTRWTPAEARDVLDEAAASGLKFSEFARRRGIPAKRLYRWRRRFQKEKAPTPMAMVELLPPPAPAHARVQIHCPSGHTVALEDIDPLASLRAVLMAICEVSPC